jgi:hypothetical protein
MTPPADVAALATLPTDLAKQEQQIRLKAAYDQQAEVYKAKLEVWTKQYAPFDQRENSVRQDPQHPGQVYGNYTALGADGRVHRYVMVPNPNGPQGPPIDLTPNGIAPSPYETRFQETSGANQANLGGLPGTPFAAPPASAPAMPPQAPGAPGGPPGMAVGPGAQLPGAPMPSGPPPVPRLPVVPAGTTYPNSSEPMPPDTMRSPDGTYMPSVMQQAMPQSAKELNDNLPEWQKNANSFAADINAAQTSEMRLRTLYRVYGMLESGAYTTDTGELLKLTTFLGIDPKRISGKNLSDIQLALHENILGTLPQLRQDLTKPTQFEFKTVSQNREHPDLSPAANQQMLQEDIAQTQRTQALASAWNTAFQQGWRNPYSFETTWSKMNPTYGFEQRVKDQFGTVKGAGGPATAHPPGGYDYDPRTNRMVPRTAQ